MALPTRIPAKAAASPRPILPAMFSAARVNSPDSANWTEATVKVEKVV